MCIVRDDDSGRYLSNECMLCHVATYSVDALVRRALTARQVTMVSNWPHVRLTPFSVGCRNKSTNASACLFNRKKIIYTDSKKKEEDN